MDVGIEDSEYEFRSDADGVGGGVEFIQEALIPGVYGVLENLLQRFEKSFFPSADIG